jgi:hypothetical protein
MGLSIMDANKIVAELKDREDYELLAFLFYLVGEAAEVDMKTPFGALKAGQLAKSTRAMADDFRLSKSTIHRRLTALKVIGLILVEGAGSKYRLTVLNWHSYRRTEEGKPILPDAPPPAEPKAKRPKKEAAFTEDSDPYKLARLLFRFMQVRIPSAKEPNFQTWAYDADLMFRLDGRTFEDAEKVLRYSQKNSFWQRNILSIDKLRKHFDRLTMEMQDEKSDLNQPNSTQRPQSKSATDKRENRFREVVSKYS